MDYLKQLIMKSISAYSLKTILILFIIQTQLSSQNVGIGTINPTSKLHLKSTVQSVTSLDLDYETGTIDPSNTGGDYDWYITGTDGQ
ncbi:MAG: hypothetical protein ACJA1A_000627 [Saprospiraceae bacterium]